MHIALSTEDFDLLHAFQLMEPETINTKTEQVLRDSIATKEIDAYIISNSMHYAKKIITEIKKNSPYTPIIVIMGDKNKKIDDGDIYFLQYDVDNIEQFVCVVLQSLSTYVNNFKKLSKLSLKNLDIIEFDDCIYDPSCRILYHNNKQIKELSSKEGDILHILAMNFKTIVKKELILEKVWRNMDYFSGRSMDVYLCNLRKMFKTNDISLTIKNIPRLGIILE